MIEPLEEVSEGEEALIEGSHDLWVGSSRSGFAGRFPESLCQLASAISLLVNALILLGRLLCFHRRTRSKFVVVIIIVVKDVVQGVSGRIFHCRCL